VFTLQKDLVYDEMVQIKNEKTYYVITSNKKNFSLKISYKNTFYIGSVPVNILHLVNITISSHKK
jgi:hypothetical protein